MCYGGFQENQIQKKEKRKKNEKWNWNRRNKNNADMNMNTLGNELFFVGKSIKYNPNWKRCK